MNRPSFLVLATALGCGSNASMEPIGTDPCALGLSVQVTPAVVTMPAGTHLQFQAFAARGGCTGPGIAAPFRWTVSDTTIAHVVLETGEVEALRPGMATVRAASVGAVPQIGVALLTVGPKAK